LWTDTFARTQPGDAEPFVRVVHQGRGDGPQLYTTVPQEVRDNVALQTDGSPEGWGILNICLLSSIVEEKYYFIYWKIAKCR